MGQNTGTSNTEKNVITKAMQNALVIENLTGKNQIQIISSNMKLKLRIIKYTTELKLHLIHSKQKICLTHAFIQMAI